MPTTAYQTIEPISEIHLPAWSTTWLGQPGCASRQLSLTASDIVCPTGSTSYYEPYVRRKIRDDRHQDGRTHSRPPYHMTPRFVHEEITQRYLVRRMNGGSAQQAWEQYGQVVYTPQACVPTPSLTITSGPQYNSWWEVNASASGSVYNTNVFDQAECDEASERVSNECQMESLSSFDLLTEAAEAREIPELVRSTSSGLIQTLKGLKSRHSWSDLKYASKIPPIKLLKHASRAIRSIGSNWMKYRYAIMPLAYSYRDALKTAERVQDMHTKKIRVVRPKDLGVSLPANTVQYIWTEYVGTITYRASAYQFFSWEEMAPLSGLGMNPLATIWELIPYSFVVDWFVNVGDYIARKTSSDLSTFRDACVSRRANYSKLTWVHFKKEDKSLSVANRIPTNWWGSYPPTAPPIVISRPEENQLLLREMVSTYQRWLIGLRDVQLRLNPSLNWKRLVDSAVMANNQLGAFIKLFKR